MSKKHPIHVLLAEVFLGHDRNSGFVVDHKDNNPLNNAMSNLQIITQRENNTKDKKRKSNHAGVVFNERNNKWLASISYNYRRINLGYYEKEEQAAQAYNKAVKQASEGQDLNALYPKSVFSSQYKGVFFDAAHNKWLAQATKDNRQRKIGRFNSEIEAYNAILQFKQIGRAHV